MVLVLKKKPVAQSSVTDMHKGQVTTETHKEEPVEMPQDDGKAPGPFCEVGIETSMTINLGNYNSTRVQCGIRIPCMHHELDEVFQFAETWVNGKMEHLMEGIVPGEG